MPDLVGQRVGDFEIVREIGRGGMGVVYEARQVSLNRKVALKILSGGLGLTPKAVQRFQREAEAAAKLHHTNIVPVYSTGELDGTHFYAMELVDGPSLDQVIRQLRGSAANAGQSAGPAPAVAQTGPYVESSSDASSGTGLSSSSLGSGSGDYDAAARAIAEVADALEYAHQQGVIHRDIKPSNLLLSSAGRLSVNDFGLARMLEQPGMTMTGEFVGTPAYMSPEQITAGRAPLDHRTDIYSLGATLYELLTLQRPFDGERRDQVIAQIMHKEPKAPRRVNRKVPLDLETICLKAMEKDPDRRYQTAGALAEDLRRYLNRFAISARRAGPIERSWKWAKRHPGMCAGLACAVLAMGIAGYFAWQNDRMSRSRQDEMTQSALDKALLVAMSGDLAEAEKVIGEAEKLGASNGQVRMLRGQVALHSGKPQEAIQHLEIAVELLPESVAARSMLAVSYSSVGLSSKYYEAMREAERLTPRTPEDYLFKGHALAQDWDYERGLAMINESLRQRPSLVASIMRAEALAFYASNLTDIKKEEPLLLAAVQEVDSAKRLLPGNAYVLWTSFYANHFLALLYDETQQTALRDQAWAKAKEDAVALEAVNSVPDGCRAHWLLLRQQGKEDTIQDRLLKVCDHPGQDLVAMGAALGFYRRGKIEDCLKVLEKKRGNPLVDKLRTVVLAEIDGNTIRAVAACKEIRAHEFDAAFLRVVSLLRLFGQKKEAEFLMDELSKKVSFLPPSWQAIARQNLDYAVGKLSADDLLRASAGSRMALCNAHYMIAITFLTEGDREKARAHLRQALLTRIDDYYPYDMSWAFLGRLTDDPNWPPWLPGKK